MSNKPSTIGEVRQSLWDINKPTLPELDWAQHLIMFDQALQATNGSTDEEALTAAYQPLFDNLATTYARRKQTPPPVPEPSLGIVYQRVAEQHGQTLAALTHLAADVALLRAASAPVTTPDTVTTVTVTLDLAEIVVMLDTLIASNHSSDYHYDLQSRKDVAGEVLRKLRATNVQAAIEATDKVLPTSSGAAVPAP